MLFNQDFINFQRSQPQLGDLLLPDQKILSSSSTSSLKSLSVGSPEYTSFILSNPATDQSGSDQAFKLGKALTPHHQINMDSYNLYRNILLPSPQSDDDALTRAILAVLSASSQKDLQQQEESRVTQASSSFQPFGSISASFEPNLRLQGQRMIKKSISLLRKMYSLKHAEARRQERLPISSKLHHVMAERKRRVRINESLRDLRMLLPPGSKKDYVTVLSKTKDYLRTLKAQINELEERNRKLEMVLKSNKQPPQVTESNERVEIQVIRASESTSEAQQIYLLIIVREEVNMIDFLLKVLECLKRMGIMNLTTIDASSNPTMASLTLQVQASDWDEESLKKSLTMAILDADKGTP
ncbi:Putative transcription factor bHLH041 [Dendrobium catenatum]|uniref:Transcription factor bHLH041 n=2 Tax=Dendrobium catenatum TaxID=906689 RepID=A0A2I0WPM4_9ASPA|nr:Putative transcription factor bHLH041 [Dendrobium catenatum]